eukprot:comp21774_c1_seq1/m.30894 comp21774_c1_seq1/g.30894  ORF comp21774_c1_seq1/g.30894 comp21774_c1_seq1/m.30894 type:complete len:340 (-) comp21774_c1_seq1:638-1657(-)
MRFLRWFKELDAFPKVLDDYTVSSASGGLVSLLTFSFIGMLLASEVVFYTGMDRAYKYTVDTNRNETNLAINIDIDIHTKCQDISADVIDLSGLSIHAEIQKTDIVYDLSALQQKWLEEQLRQRDLGHDIADVLRVGEQLFKNMPTREDGRVDNDACKLTGTINVRRVAGNFHFTAGQAIHTPGGHFHMNVPQSGLNFTHRINRLSFGDDFPGVVNPLDGETVVLQEEKMAVQYFLSIVPTEYTAPDGKAVHTNQYSYTLHNQQSFPGIFFKYDLNPILMRVVDTPRSTIRTLVRLAGIVGGIFATSVVIHALVDRLSGLLVREPADPPFRHAGKAQYD